MNELILNNDEKIENLIYEIRGVQVMLDSDLAKLYQVETILSCLVLRYCCCYGYSKYFI